MKEDNTDGSSFVYYPSFYSQIKAITDEKIRYEIHEAIARYGLYGEEPNFKKLNSYGLLDSLFIPIKRAINDAKRRRDTYIENGSKGGAPKGNQNARKHNITEDSPEPSTEEEIITPEEVTPKNTPKRFVKPTLKELRDYIFEEGIKAEAEAIFDYYEANGWNVGKNKMKDWRACVRNWARRQSEFAPKRANKNIGSIHFSGEGYTDWFTEDKPEEPQTQTLMEAIMQGYARGEAELQRKQNTS